MSRSMESGASTAPVNMTSAIRASVEKCDACLLRARVAARVRVRVRGEGEGEGEGKGEGEGEGEG